MMLKYYFMSFLSKCWFKMARPKEFSHISWIELFYYTLRQGYHNYKKTFTKALKTYQVYDTELASMHTPYGKIYVPRNLDDVALRYLLRESFDKNHWHHFDAVYTPILEGDVVVDCGSSDGLWALSIIEKVKKIYLIEPQKEFVHALERNFTRYVKAGKAVIFEYAIGSLDGYCNIIRANPADLNGVIKYNEKGTVVLRCLDSLFKDESISFIKADIEGFEMDLLKGAREVIRRDRPKLALTVYHASNDWNTMKDYVLSLVPGYRWKIKGMMRWGKPLLLHMWVGSAIK